MSWVGRLIKKGIVSLGLILFLAWDLLRDGFDKVGAGEISNSRAVKDALAGALTRGYSKVTPFLNNVVSDFEAMRIGSLFESSILFIAIFIWWFIIR